MELDRKLAVLIDADNVSPKYIQFIFEETANHGVPTYKRIYGDWTKPQLVPWKEVLLQYSVTPMQQYNYTTGKNSTDSALIIDAMDILYSENVDGFCIVSSDSDFTKLATRLRESGMFVMGMGEVKTPKPFISACERFFYLDYLTRQSSPESTAVPSPQTVKSDPDDLRKLINQIRTIVTEQSDEGGWAFLGTVGGILNKRFPDFDARNYGYAKLSTFIVSLNAFEIDNRKTSDLHITHTYIKNK